MKYLGEVLESVLILFCHPFILFSVMCHRVPLTRRREPAAVRRLGCVCGGSRLGWGPLLGLGLAGSTGPAGGARTAVPEPLSRSVAGRLLPSAPAAAPASPRKASSSAAWSPASPEPTGACPSALCETELCDGAMSTFTNSLVQRLLTSCLARQQTGQDDRPACSLPSRSSQRCDRGKGWSHVLQAVTNHAYRKHCVFQ